MNKRTKIIATIGPASESPEAIAGLVKNGVNVFRFNMKHAAPDWHCERIERVQEVADSLGEPVGIMIDLQGPELRVSTPAGDDIFLQKGERVVFRVNLSGEGGKRLGVAQPEFYRSLQSGDIILVDDGLIELRVDEARETELEAEVVVGGVVGDHKGVNIPGHNMDLPSLVDFDLDRLDAVAKHEVDFIGLSFTRSAKDIEILRNELIERKIDAKVIAKIESAEGLENLAEILQATDIVMVARGDLGVEVSSEKLTYHQKQSIESCRKESKPVIVATQMLQSMVDNPLPTRAEISDVANAVYDGADALMLSAETAVGKYPLRAVGEMARIVSFNEEVAIPPSISGYRDDPTALLIQAAVGMLSNDTAGAEIDYLIVVTETGRTARMISAHRPRLPIIAVTGLRKTVEELTLSYGIDGVKLDFSPEDFLTPQEILDQLVERQKVREGQRALLIYGRKWKYPGLNNTLSLLKV